MPRRGPVETAVRRDLARLDAAARRSGLAASALELAQVLDGELRTTCRECLQDVTLAVAISARDAATVAAELRQTLAELGRRARPKRQEDTVDQLRARRDARRAAADR